MPSAYEGTDIISYFHEVKIYHAALAVYHIAQAIYHFIQKFQSTRQNSKNIFFIAHRQKIPSYGYTAGGIFYTLLTGGFNNQEKLFLSVDSDLYLVIYGYNRVVFVRGSDAA